MSDDNHDRAAILARRAVLVASALATVGVSARVEAQSGLNAAEECAPRREPSAEELEEAKRLVAQAELDGGDHDAAIAKLLRAYTLAPRPGVAALLMSRHEAAGDFDAAQDTAKRELACGGPNPELSARIADLERRTGLLRVFDAGAGIATVHIGQRTFDFLRARSGIRLSPGDHLVTVTFSSGQVEKRSVRVAAGQTTDAELGPTRPAADFSGTQPVPCLSMPAPEHEERYAVHLGFTAPVIAVTGDDPHAVAAGGGLRMSFAVQLVDDLWFDGDLFTMITYGDDRFIDMGGTVAELRYHPGSTFGFGGGFSGGVIATYRDGADDDDAPREAFFGPVIVPASVLAADALIELRVPLWFSTTYEGSPKHDLRLGLIAPHLVVSWGIKDKYLARMF